MLTNEQKASITAECKRLIRFANENILPTDRPLNPDKCNVLFTKRGKTAGTAHIEMFSGRWEVNINQVLMSENWQEMWGVTLPHEVAHIVADWKWKKRCHHGRLWKDVMAAFGLRGDRCHDFDTKNTQDKRKPLYEMTCGCGKAFVWTPQKFARVRERIAGRLFPYSCKKCRGHLVLHKVLHHNGIDWIPTMTYRDAPGIAVADAEMAGRALDKRKAKRPRSILKIPAPTRVAANNPNDGTEKDPMEHTEYINTATELVKQGKVAEAVEAICKGTKKRAEVALRTFQMAAGLDEKGRNAVTNYLTAEGRM